MFETDRDRFPFVDRLLGEATVQEIHLELIRRSQHNLFDGEDVLEDLSVSRIFGRPSCLTDRAWMAEASA